MMYLSLRSVTASFPSGLVRGVSFLVALRSLSRSLKWHYFKVLLAPGRCAFWPDDEGNPFPWVYWNREVKDFVIYNLDPLETAAFNFLVSLSAGLPKKNNFTCRWILDHNDADVGRFLDDLFSVKMKKTKLDRLMTMMADPSRMVPRALLLIGGPSSTAAAVASVTSSTNPVASSANPAASSTQVPPPPPASSKTKKGSSKRERSEAFNVEGEEGKIAALEHEVNPLDVAFPENFNYWKALDAGLTSSSVRKPLQTMLPDQLLDDSWRLSCQSLAFGLESALVAKTKAEEALLGAKDQISVMKTERDSALAYLPLKEKVDSLTQDLSQIEMEHQSSLDQVA
ncbi:hypothetical protein PIB30_023906 [Stylosanthes scabra]|uniref:Uncharacterized protein n=1 Tax=Stylosanthes scabra TaxID=79078 RepID=A0ABU6UAQ6_9FABA|nr:hypothetical protein [Stylosanthes scabra]